jgi:hypothetical protein
MVRIRSRKVVGVFLPIIFLSFANRALAERTLAQKETIKRIQAITTKLESRLQMAQEIQVSIVPVEARMLSVQRIRKASGTEELFLITLDRTFLKGLTETELTAALAHELGHVWIFSHHPYLQTEALANEIAMRAVSRDDLKTLYGKLWLHMGTAGSLQEVLGNDKAQAAMAVPVTTSATHPD